MDFGRIERCGIVPVVAIPETSKAIELANALLAGGIDVMEITYRTPNASEVISLLRREVPNMHIGAGTVVNTTQLDAALKAGAEFVVSPGMDANLVKACVDSDVTVLPGAVTPTEIMVGLNLGLKVFKFFPSSIYGGLKTMQALRGPFGDIRFVPTGGISDQNLLEYASEKSILGVGGSWMVATNLIDQSRFDEVTARSAAAVHIWAKARP